MPNLLIAVSNFPILSLVLKAKILPTSEKYSALEKENLHCEPIVLRYPGVNNIFLTLHYFLSTVMKHQLIQKMIEQWNIKSLMKLMRS